jgi:hypothetical protein
MTARLAEDQRRAIEERGGTPIDVVDDATNAHYVLLRAEEYESLKAAVGKNEADAMYPLLADLDPDDWEDAGHYGIGKP